MISVVPGTAPITHRVRVLGVSDEVRIAGDIDGRIAQIASWQRGRICSPQLRAAGISRTAIQWRVRRSRLFPLHYGVYAAGHPGPVALGDETAALLAAGMDAVVGGLSAAALWGLIHPEAADGPIEILVPRQRRLTLPRVTVRRTQILLPRDVAIKDGLPLTSPARTLLDLAEQTTLRRAELAFDRGLIDRLVTRAQVSDVIDRANGRRGAGVLRALVEPDRRTATVTRSEAEERMLALVRAAQLPVPRVNARLHGYEVDFYWPEARLVLEVDGFRFHSGRRAFEHDRRKDAALTAAGLSVIRVTWHALTTEPLAVVARLTAALTRRAA